ncbi:MAG TPA: YfhO family protein [Thermoanaerobaculia bacterium]|nr:YfhO family protein [Thermoanaerobaculia bacterium]
MKGMRVVPLLVIVAAAALLFARPLARGEVFTFRDHSDYFQPLRFFTAQHLQHGRLPLWNPYSASGEPWLANPQTGVFYPPAWLFALLPLSTAYMLFLFLHLALLGCGAYLLFARGGGGRGAALAGAVAIMLAGPTLSLLDISNNLATYAWLPLVIWCALERAARAPRISRGAAAAILTLAFLGGEPFFAAIAAAIFAIVVIFARQVAAEPHRVAADSRRPAWSSSLADVAVTGLLAFGLSAVQLLPFLATLRGSDRSEGLLRGEIFRESMPPVEWARIAVPLAPGAAAFDPALSQHFIPIVYSGALVVLLAVLAWIVFLKCDWQTRWLIAGWTTLLAISIVIAAGDRIPLAGALIARSPVTLFRYPARMIPIGVLAVVALAVIGARAVGAATLAHRIAAIVLLIALVAATRPPMSLGLAGTLLITALIVIAVPHAFERRWPVALVVVLFMIDLVPHAVPILGSAPLRIHPTPYQRSIGLAAKFIRLPDELSRPHAAPVLYDRKAWIAGYLGLYDRRFDAWTAAPMVSARYTRLYNEALVSARLDLLDQMSAGYLVTRRELPLPIAAKAGEVTVYANRQALPIAALWTTWTETGSDEEAFTRVLEARGNVLFTTGAEPAPADAPRFIHPAPFVALDAESARVIVNAPRPGLLVLTQQAAPGWSVSVDGVPRPQVVAQGVFRAVAVSAGRHDVMWRYAPPGLAIGATITLLTLIACGIEILIHHKG